MQERYHWTCRTYLPDHKSIKEAKKHLLITTYKTIDIKDVSSMNIDFSIDDGYLYLNILFIKTKL